MFLLPFKTWQNGEYEFMKLSKKSQRIKLGDIDPQYEKSKHVMFSELNEDQESSRWNILLADIKENGIYHAVLVGKKNPKTGKYPLLDGRQRFRAAEVLGFTEIDCEVIQQDLSPQREIQLIQKTQNLRRHNTPESVRANIKERYLDMIRAQKIDKLVSNLAEYISKNDGLTVSLVKKILREIKEEIALEEIQTGKKELSRDQQSNLLGYYKEYLKITAKKKTIEEEVRQIETRIKKIAPLTVAKKLYTQNQKSAKN